MAIGNCDSIVTVISLDNSSISAALSIHIERNDYKENCVNSKFSNASSDYVFKLELRKGSSANVFADKYKNEFFFIPSTYNNGSFLNNCKFYFKSNNNITVDNDGVLTAVGEVGSSSVIEVWALGNSGKCSSKPQSCKRIKVKVIN